MIFSSDNPIANIEKDMLNRKNYIDKICRIIHEVCSDSSFTISIEGKWGEGKTSVLNFLKNKLSEDNSNNSKGLWRWLKRLCNNNYNRLNVHVVDFNPWLLGKKELFLQELLEVMIQVVKKSSMKDKGKLLNALDSYSKYLSVLSGISAISYASNIITTYVNERKKLTEKSVSDLKKNLINLLKKSNDKIVIFIDDVDRLYPAEIYEVIRIIKSAFDLPNVYFVIAFDTEYLTESLENLEIPLATSFLDKIIQVRLPLPSAFDEDTKSILVQRVIDSYNFVLKKNLNNISQNSLYELYNVAGFKNLVETPRDLQRMSNTLSLVVDTFGDEIVFVDLMAISLIIAKYPNVYRFIVDFQDYFTGYSMLLESKGFTEQHVENEYEEILSTISKRNDLVKVISFLFPNCLGKIKNNSFDRVSNIMMGRVSSPLLINALSMFFIEDHKISSEKVFDFFKKAISYELIGKLSPHSFKQYLRDVKFLSDYINHDEINMDVIFENFTTIIHHSLSVDDEYEWNFRTSFLQSSPFQEVGILIDEILNKIGCERKCSTIERLLYDPYGVFVAPNLIEENKSSIAEFLSTQDPHVDENYSSCSKLASVSYDFNIVVENIANQIDNDKLNYKYSLHLFSFISRHSPSNCKEIFEVIARDCHAIDCFIEVLTTIAISMPKGKRFDYSKRKDILSKYCADEELKQIANSRYSDDTISPYVRGAWESVIKEQEVVVEW